MISRGEGAFGTIYEKLRKRSYRASLKWGTYLSTPPHSGEPSPPPRWMAFQHEAYVQGVKDALEAAQGVKDALEAADQTWWNDWSRDFVVQEAEAS